MRNLSTSIILGLSIFTNSLFAITSPLVDPSRTGSQIVDIGYNGVKVPTVTSIPKTIQEIPALTRELDKNIELKDRDLEFKDCLIDDNGFESCPTNQEECSGNLVFNQGSSVTNSGTVYTSKLSQTVTNPYYLNNSPSPSATGWGGLLSSYNINIGTYNFTFNSTTSGNHTVRIQADNFSTVKIDGVTIHSDTSDAWGEESPKTVYLAAGEHSIYISAGNYSGPAGVAVTIADPSGNVFWNTRTGQGAATMTTQYCPSPYIDNGSNCRLDYTYYTYQCPVEIPSFTESWDDSNPGGSWVGPMNAGGDCGGIGLNGSLECNSPTPPAQNCLRTNYYCAINPDNECIKMPGSSSNGENIFDGMQYAPGISTHFSNTKHADKICENGGTYNETREVCEADKEYICLKEGYTYNEDAGECLGDFTCNDFWNAADQKCESIPVVECDSGFSYNTTTMRCEKDQDCNTGALNSGTNLCESEPYCGTEPGWSYDDSAAKCYKDLNVINLLYEPEVPSLQKLFTMDEFQHDTLVFDVTWASGDLDIHAIGYNASGGAVYHLWYGGRSANGGTLSPDRTSGGTEEVRIPVAQWRAAGVVRVDFDMDAYSGGTLSSYNATASYTDRDGIKRTFPLVGSARYMTLIRFDLNTYKIIYKAPEVVIPEIIINYCDPDPQYVLSADETTCTYDYTNYSICPSGYSYSPEYNICYESTGEEVLDILKYSREPICAGSGVWNDTERKCEEAPTCFNGFQDPFEHKCFADETNNCFSPTVAASGISFENCAPALNCNEFSTNEECLTCRTIRIAGYDTVCQNTNVCSGTAVEFNFDGNLYCKDTKQFMCPQGYTEDPNNENQCIGEPTCESGYVENETDCTLTYNWSEYSCEAGWTGPQEAGADCDAQCGADGCWCNGENAPANNCSQSVSIAPGGADYTLTEKRLMDLHLISNGTFKPEDFGEFRNMVCGDNCQFYVNEIEGFENNLCFKMKNGEEKCFEVDGCYFDGHIVPNSQNPDGWIGELELIDNHTLRSNFATKLNNQGPPQSCDIGTYNPVSQLCEPEEISNYSAWNEYGSDMDWSIRTDGYGDNAMFQSLNTSANAFYLHPENVQNVTMEGKIGIAPCNDDDTIGLVWGYTSINDFYGLMWSKANTGGGTTIGGGANTGLRLVKVTGGSITELGMKPDSEGWSCGTNPVYANFKVIVAGNNIKVYKNSTLMFDVTEAAELPRGKAGYFGVSQRNAWYKDFTMFGDPECPVGTFLDMEDGLCHVYECDEGWTVDFDAQECVKSIVSTCRMNGHVGWNDRVYGISSIGTGSMQSRISLIEAIGTASYDANNHWEGFNIGTMAVQLSDGFWYVVDEVKDAAGNVVARPDLPSWVKTIPYYNYQNMSTDTSIDCKTNGVDTPGYCSDTLKLVLPGTKMSIIGFSDLESLIGLSSMTSNNTFDLDITFGSYTFEYRGSGKMNTVDLSNETNIYLQSATQDALSNQLEFWDSFQDMDIGILEFIREVKDEDRAENFVPENLVPYALNAEGFTSIDYLEDFNKTLIVKTTFTDPADCAAKAAELGGIVYSDSFIPDDKKPLVKSRGVTEPGACAILVNERNSFEDVYFGVRTNIYGGDYTWKCSEYVCAGHECGTATCPTESYGGVDMQNGVTTTAGDVEYQGNILPANIMPAADSGICIDQVCDAKLDYIDQCGIETTCQKADNILFDEVNDQCFQYYCENGQAFNPATKMCETMACPFGTTEDSNGYCTPN